MFGTLGNLIDLPLGVIPVLMGPLQVLLALLPAIIAALFGLVLAVLRPSAIVNLVRFLWHQKLFTLCLAGLGACYFSGFPLSWIGRSAGAADEQVDPSTEWPAFRGGGTRLGAVSGGGDPTLPSTVWTARRDMTIYASPAVCGDRVYISTIYGISPFNISGRGAILCLDAHTGEELWRYAPSGFRGTFSSPVVKDGYLICGEGLHQTADARITCLDLAGRKRWELVTKSHVESTACIAHGRAYIGAGDDGFYCLELEPNDDGTPRIAWHLDPKKYPDCESCPLVHEGIVYLGLGEEGQAICAIDAATGEERWRIATPYPVFAPPTIEAGKLYIGMGNGNYVQSAEDILAARLEQMKEDGKPPEEIEAARKALAPGGAIWCIDLATREIEWKFPLPDTVLGAIACRGGRLYFGSRDGHCYCLSTDGKLLHKFNCREPILGSPAVGSEHLYIATKAGRLFALRADTLAAAWDASLGPGTSLISSPALAHGHLYIGTESGLRCVGVVEPPPPPLWTSGERGGLAGNEPLGTKARVVWRYPQEQDEPWRVTAPLMPLGEHLYVAGVRGKKSQFVKLRTDAELADDARRVWEATFDGEIEVPPGGVGDRLLIAEGPAGRRVALYCLSAQDGSKLWSHQLSGDASGQFTLDRQHVYIWLDGHTLACLDVASGATRWDTSLSCGDGIGQPALLSDIVLATGRTGVAALDTPTGTVLWQIPLADSPRFGPLVIGNDFIIVTDEGVSLRRITDGKARWETRIGRCSAPPVHSGEHIACVTEAGEVVVLALADGSVVQRRPCQKVKVPVLLRHGLAVFIQADQLFSLDIASGQATSWLGMPEAGRLLAPLVGQADQAYFAVENEGVVCVRPTMR